MRHALVLCFLLASSLLLAQPLERQGFLGVAPQPAENGLIIASVVPDGTADRLGVEQGDLLQSVNGLSMDSPMSLLSALSNLKSGDEVRLLVQRGESELMLEGPLKARPFEQPDIGSVRYDSVDYADGRLRTLINTPDGDGPFPTVFYIQGYPCQTVESPNPSGFNRRLAELFVEAGFAVVRVEKPGMGDSDGPLRCEEIDFDTETAGFAAAWEYAIDLDETLDSRMFMIGISMGGIQAPLIAAASERKPFGTIVWGTRVDNWHDYMLDLAGVQPALIGADPVEAYEAAEAARPALRRFLIEQAPLETVLDEVPDAAASLMRVGMAADGSFFGRSASYFQGIAAYNLRAAWRDGGGAVLSLYGASDITAVSGFDQALIATIVNHYRPGTAEFVEVPRTSHAMAEVGTRAEYRRHWQQGTAQQLASNFNPEVPAIMVEWMRAKLSEAAQ
ncbi:MAG: alpha/beta fold hydrolase [Wenzhouxiangella sp.]|jgi:pimeloyl-ACP methyl ester carboxylesterase|nr:alpha/beta fold hydrolase [Wenzhouxiangella sp.]